MAKRRRFTAEFKAKVVLEAFKVKVHKWRRVRNRTISAKINSRSGSSNSLKMRHLCMQSQWLLNQHLTILDNRLETPLEHASRRNPFLGNKFVFEVS